MHLDDFTIKLESANKKFKELKFFQNILNKRFKGHYQSKNLFFNKIL